MMMLRKLFANTLYVQVRRNGIRVRQIEGMRERDVSAARPFTTTRLLVGQFKEAEELLRKTMGEVASGGMFQVSPVVVIHPLEMVEGGLSEVEERLFKEMALGAGARSVFLHLGPTLTDEQVIAVVYGRPT